MRGYSNRFPKGSFYFGKAAPFRAGLGVLFSASIGLQEGAVISKKQIKYYESLVAREEEIPEEAITPILRQYAANLRDAWEARVILRDLRNRAGIATCSGEVDCVETPTSLCMKGEHQTSKNVVTCQHEDGGHQEAEHAPHRI